MTILITGGSKGIGRGIAERFATEGAHVIVNYSRDDNAADEAKFAIERLGGRATLLKHDLATPSGMTALTMAVAACTDHLDQIVHGAVWPLSASSLSVSIDDFQRATWLNGSSLLALVQGTMGLLLRGSTIYQMSSRGTKLAVPNYVAVGAPKALGEALVRYLAAELAPQGIRVNTVSCSLVVTDAIKALRPNIEEQAVRVAAKNPSRRNVEARDVAELIYQMSQPGLEMLTGRELTLDGGANIIGR